MLDAILVKYVIYVVVCDCQMNLCATDHLEKIVIDVWTLFFNAVYFGPSNVNPDDTLG